MPKPGARLQAQETPTIDPEMPVVLALDKAVTTPLDNQELFCHLFTFSGKANQVISVVAQLESGNMGLDVNVSSQNDVELARANGSFLQSLSLTVKLPQHGKYNIRLTYATNPGSREFEAGTASVIVTEGMAVEAATPASK